MKGVRICNKNLGNPSERKIDYEFEEIIKVIKEDVYGLYWLLNNVDFKYKALDGEEFTEYEEMYDECILKEDDETRLSRKNFIIDNAKFVNGDWDTIIGIESVDDFEKVKKLKYNSILKNARIICCCIDALYWEIYSSQDIILKKIKDNFPNNENCNWEQSKWK